MNRDPLVLRPWLAFAALALSTSGCHTAPPPSRPPVAAQTPAASIAPAPARPPSLSKDVFPHHVRPHWLPDNTHFFYRNELADGMREYLLVDATTGERTPLFDHARLAAALTQATGKKLEPDQLHLHQVELDDKRTTMLFSIAEKRWRCDLRTYAVGQEVELR